MKSRFRRLRQLVENVVRSALKDNLLHWSAAIAFYAALSSAPLMFVILILSSFFVDADWAASRLTNVLGNFLPDESESRVREFVTTAVESRGRVGLFSGVTLLFSGTRVFAALTRAIHVIFDDEEERQFFRELAAQGIMLVSIGGIFVLALTSRYLLGAVSEAIDFLPSDEENAVRTAITLVVQIALLFGAFTLVYRFVPGERDQWGPPLIGGACATVAFIIVRPVFIFYLDRFGQQDVIYGSLASIAILLLWVWIGSIITLAGAEIVNYLRNGDRSRDTS